MQPIEIKDLIEKNAGPSVFSVDNIWSDPGPIHKKYTAFLTPDSRTYTNSINPIFSFELEDTSLRFFNILSLRDGVYPLLRFFAMNPVPHVMDSSLIVDASLASLVPKEWRSKVLLRELYVEKPVFDYQANECLLLISPNQDSQPLDLFIKEINKYKGELQKFKKLSIYFSSCALKGEEENMYVSNCGYSLLRNLMANFPDKEIEILEWYQYEKKNVAHTAFLVINPLKFYFSDSYLVHDLAQRGARSLIETKGINERGYKKQISINHGYNIYSWEGPEFSYFDEDFKKVFSNKSIHAKPAWDDYLLVKLTTSEFKDFSAHVAREIYNT